MYPGTARSHRGRVPAWVHYRHAAWAALLRRTLTDPELSPDTLAEIVLGVLPERLCAAMRRALEQLGWLGASAVVPCAALDDPRCPRHFREPRRAFVRLAVFGLPGQGLSYRDKHRQDIYQQLCAQIMSGAVDPHSLNTTVQRALNHPDVRSDPVLASMLRSFIAEREAALRAQRSPEDEFREEQARSKLRRAFDTTGVCQFPSREEVLMQFARNQRDFERYVAQYEEGAAGVVLNRMRELRRKYPAHVPAAELQHCEEQLDQLMKRSGAYRRLIPELAARGVEAADAGDQQTATWVMRRLEAIHSLFPNLLPRPQLEELCDGIASHSRRHDQAEAARELNVVERDVVLKIKQLAGVIQRFHQLKERGEASSDAYRGAQENYRRAVAAIREMDTEWLAGLMLQIETLLEDLDDPSGRMQDQLDEFIVKVRTALNRLRMEIRAHHALPRMPPAAPDVRDSGAAAVPPT